MTLNLRAAASVLAFCAAALPAVAQTPATETPATPAPATEAPATPAAPAPATPAAPAETAPAAASQSAPATLPDIVLGQESAPVEIIEYASFTCPHCAAFHNESFDALKSEYIDSGKVKFVQRDVYFDQVGLWAGVLAHCGGDDKYYDIAGALFDQQNTWLNAKTAEDLTTNLRKLGTEKGLSNEQMDTCWADQKKVEQLVATFQKNATDDSVEGTPTFIINGEKVANLPWAELKAKIDEKVDAAPKPASN